MQGSSHSRNSAEDIATVVASVVVVELLSLTHNKSFCVIVGYEEQKLLSRQPRTTLNLLYFRLGLMKMAYYIIGLEGFL